MYNNAESKEVKQCAQVYSQVRTTINLELVRFRNIVTRYQLIFGENWLKALPAKQHKTDPQYRYTFHAEMTSAVIREFELIRGALSDNLRQEKKRDARHRWTKLREDCIFPTAKWFIRPEHSKITLTACGRSGFVFKSIKSCILESMTCGVGF